MSKEKKYKNIVKQGNESLNTAQDIIDAGVAINGVPTRTGLFNTPVNRTKFHYNTPAGARIFECQGAYITMGQVPMGATEFSGFGAVGLPAEAIDLVVGRGSSLNKGKGPKKGEVVNNNHLSDAGRIYICRLTDVDKEFNLATDPKEEQLPGSAVAVKADRVRLIGREGIKIITGKVFTPYGGEEKNSSGGDIIRPAPTIDLVAGNNYDNVQGVALGERTAECLNDLNKIVGQIWSTVYSMALIQAGFNGVVGVTPQPWISAAAPVANMGIYTNVMSSLYHTRTSATLWELNYLNPLPQGKKYIVSTNVRTN